MKIPRFMVLVLFRFEEAAEQFRIDVAENPNDTEESIWCFLCEAQLYGVDEARQRFLEVSDIIDMANKIVSKPT